MLGQEMEARKRNTDKLPDKSIVDFFERGTPITRLIKSRSPLNERRLYILGVAKRYFSLKEFLVLMLPLSVCSSKSLYLRRQREVFNLEARDELGDYLSADGSVNLFGRAFHMPDRLDALTLVLHVALADQYHARKFIKKDSVVIDAGANIGPFSVLAAHLAPEGHVYVFEPAAGTFSFLETNAKGYSNLTCFNAGLGEAAAEKKLLNRGVGHLGNVIEDSPLCKQLGAGSGNWEKVAVTTIDEFVSRNRIARFDFLKIDTEGYEARILRGAAESIKTFRPIIAMSAYHNPEDKTELPKLLRSIDCDYICELYRDVEEHFICHAN
ncbi:MAG: FkbM family methyltransferase [Acidobacteria bacterium]|nr:MAG: FkbM family methyltransferase [Acidobacteriota bacterium]